MAEALSDPAAALDVLAGRKKHYRTAFFEAFPRNPNTFIRGEGKTIAEAESQAWEEYQRVAACPGHEFEARGYENGGGLCKHCGMFGSKVIAPIHPCPSCGVLNWYSKDALGRFWCKDHWLDAPKDCLSEEAIKLRELHADLQEYLKSQQEGDNAGANQRDE